VYEFDWPRSRQWNLLRAGDGVGDQQTCEGEKQKSHANWNTETLRFYPGIGARLMAVLRNFPIFFQVTGRATQQDANDGH
jgi:hypothetical protein